MFHNLNKSQADMDIELIESTKEHNQLFDYNTKSHVKLGKPSYDFKFVKLFHISEIAKAS